MPWKGQVQKEENLIPTKTNKARSEEEAALDLRLEEGAAL